MNIMLSTIILFAIFTVLVYLRRTTLTCIEFSIVFVTLLYTLWVLYKTDFDRIHAYELFVDQEAPIEEEYPRERRVSWRQMANLPIKVKEEVFPQLDELIKGMTVGIEAQGDAQGVDPDEIIRNIVNKSYFQDMYDSSDNLKENDVQTMSQMYRDANYALSMIERYDIFKFKKIHDIAQINSPEQLDLQLTEPITT